MHLRSCVPAAAAVVLVLLSHLSRAEAQGDGWFRFDPPDDPFTNEALLDMRRLHPDRAGGEGPIVSRDGQFVCADSGRVVRFLSINGPNPWGRPWAKSADRRTFAKRLAKMGVNHMRIGPVRGIHKMTGAHLDAMQELIARCAEEGIYSGVTFFFPLEVRLDVEGYKGKGLQSLVFFHPKVQEAYFEWLEKILTSPNPHTGMPLAKDPALSIVELVNEDNLFFYTFSPSKTMPESARAILERRFGQWLTDRYGSIGKALARWGAGARRKGDQPDRGRVEVYDAFMFMDADWARQQRDPKRTADTLRFLVDLQRDFYSRAVKKLRSWGYRSPVTATNWKTVNPPMLDALDKYANMAGDMLDRHAYFGSGHMGPQSGYRLRKGHYYQDRSMLTTPDSLVNGVYYQGYPQFMSEHQYPMPNAFRAEMVWLATHYGALTGLDAFSTNEFHTPGWERTHRKFCAYTPVVLGQYPAAALVYRQGRIAQADPVYVDTVTPEQLYKGRGTSVWDDMRIDDFRKDEVRDGGDQAKAELDPLASFVGPVVIDIADKPAPIRKAPIDRFIDREARTVTSRTGQLRLDWRTGVARANAPGAQSACGFLGKAGEIQLDDVVIDLDNRYGAVWLASMDDKPLVSSSKMLLQVMTEERTAGRKVREATYQSKRDGELVGWEILATGKGPLEVREIAGKVKLSRGDTGRLEVVALDHNGYPREKLKMTDGTIDLLPDVIWYVIRKP